MTVTSAATTNETGKSRFRCPCQHIPLSLSSATSAEYGDVASLARRMKAANQNISVSNNSKRQAGGEGLSAIPGISDGGITPLHLAAQHGHPAAVSLLLNEGCCEVDTGLPIIMTEGSCNDNQSSSNNSNNREDSRNKTKLCGATPLHRASFSGATSSMQVLLSWRRHNNRYIRGVDENSTLDHNLGVNLLARDVSFGDQRTPLHKAVAGGRPLAVQLLLNALRERQLLREGLLNRDASGLTPLELARQFTSLDEVELEQERCSVRRWDVVAGGSSADWGTCQKLLEGCTTSVDASINNQDTVKANISIPDLPPCTNSDDCVDGKCRTAAWESSFRMALFSSMKASLDENATSGTSSRVTPIKSKGIEFKGTQPSTNKSLVVTAQVDKTIGRKCDKCGSPSAVLFRAKNSQLVCRPCHRNK